MAVLVTGGTGYIGSHTVVQLLENGYEVIIMDNLVNSQIEVINRIKTISGKAVKFYESDIKDTTSLNKIFTENNIRTVIHFAALKAPGESVEQPLLYYDNNIIGSICLLNAMKKAGVKSLVYSSSACVYGVVNNPPLIEDMQLSSINPYGWTKVMNEQMLMDLCQSDKEFKAVALRYFNPLGAHESGLIGESPNGTPNNLAPYITQVLTGKQQQLTVNGADYDTQDGTCIRDYIHVCDLAQGHVKALQFIEEINGYHTINLGRGHGESVLSVIKSFEEATGKEVPYVIGPRRPGDVSVSFADVTKAKEILGWSAQKDIIEMCKDAWNWQVKNPNGYNNN